MAHLKYMIERQAVKNEAGELDCRTWKVLGFWVLTPEKGLKVYYPDKAGCLEQDGKVMVNHFIEQGISVLPDDFLEDYLYRAGSYSTNHSIDETDEYSSADALGAALLAKLAAGEIK